MVQKHLADLRFHVSEVGSSFTDFIYQRPQISYLSSLQSEAHCASVFCKFDRRESNLTTISNLFVTKLGLPSSTAICVTVCCSDWQSRWAGSQEEDWSKSRRGCTVGHLSRFIILISCRTVTEHLIRTRWYSTSRFTSTLCQHITHTGYFCGAGPIMEHDLILLDTKPIQRVIVSQGHPLSPRSVRATG